ncbi:carbohydrate ABC transporter permease [Georgenia muralis]|uniref:Carbohydrate ABC transporter membrane protein 1 (CUT1 family) n=1 Tax=Georgenia muralis TaxID=154117 RepID=A0A3N4ZPZ7_9MICO|nr:sugar ABC transporter permease [Georgenia muralis]RPF27728.1 carbohydrate ABC transporter membrane protein 1 (CUT1 family) [Georgenia muralis]
MIEQAPSRAAVAPSGTGRAAGGGGAGSNARRRRRRATVRAWLLLSPALVLLGVLLLVPLVRVVQLSFQDYGLRELAAGTTNPVGWANYAEILSSPYLWQTVLPNTVGFALVCVTLTVTLGTLVALFLNTLSTRWRVLCSTAIMVAWAVPAVTGTYVLVWIFDPLNGLVASVLADVGLIEAGTVNWFAHRVPFYAIATLNVVHHGFPFIAITVLAGLMTVPVELYEAARIDGAGAWRRFWNITVPMLRPVFAVVTILSTIWDFKVFTQIYLMPGGNGGNPDVYNLGVWSYLQSFAQGKYGMGSAIAVLLTLILLAVTVVYTRTVFKEQDL